jgi:hypothetical protein
LSHIMAGHIENSPAKGFVRVNEVYDDKLATSFFNYKNVTKEGLVDNTLTTYDPAVKKPSIWRGYVDSNYPIFAKDILIAAGAVFEGLVQRNFNEALVAAVSLQYHRFPCLLSANSFQVGYHVRRSNSSHSLCQQLPCRSRLRLLFPRIANSGGYRVL